MDFFGILFDMKNGKKVPYSKTYFDTLFAESLAGVTTITGTLPLTFTTSETALRSWTIYGADIEHVETATGKSITFYTDEDKLRDWTIYGNDGIGKNLFEITTTPTTISGVTFTVDETAGTITANGTANTAVYLNLPINAPSGDYYYSGCALGGSASTYDLYAWDKTISGRPKKWDGETNVDSDYGGTSQEIKVDSEHSMQLTIRIRSGYTCNNLVFKPMLRQSDTTPDFEPYQVGVGEPTKNILDVSSFEDVNVNNAVMILNDDNATVSVYTTDTPTTNVQGLLNFEVAETGNYLFSGVPKDAANPSLNSFIWDRDANNMAKAWDKTTDMTTQSKNFQIVEVYLEQGVRYQFRLRVQSSYGIHTTPVTVSPMIRLDGTTDSFIPFGYYVPLTISQTGQIDKNYDIYIGDSPLTEGETVSKSSTGVDIATAGGNNTITTSLYNQPDMSITYNEFTGVGILTANLFMIALKLEAGGQTESAFNLLMNKPLRAGETLTSEQTGQTINTVAGVENKLSPSPKAAAYGGNFEMTIKFKE